MKKVALDIVEEPSIRSIALVRPQSGFRGPFFVGRGKGQIDFVCGYCGKTLAKGVWHDSIRSIVVDCSYCHSYNEFPSEPKSAFLVRIQILAGTFYFEGPLHLDFGKVVEGQVLPKREMKRSDVDSLLGRENEDRPITRDDVLRIIAANEGITNGIDLSDRNMAAIDLSDLDLRGIDFRGSAFRSGRGSTGGPGARLDNSDLQGCRLDAAVFSHASMKSANLSGTIARKADFSWVDLTEVDFSSARLESARFSYSNLDKAVFRLASLDGAFFLEAKLGTAYFAEASVVSAK